MAKFSSITKFNPVTLAIEAGAEAVNQIGLGIQYAKQKRDMPKIQRAGKKVELSTAGISISPKLMDKFYYNQPKRSTNLGK